MNENRAAGTGMAYVLGHSDRELERLHRQGELFADLTRDILVRSGLTKGMRVLDIGSGAGDVAAIAADIVTAAGAVLGIDPAPEALAVARARLDALGKPWVRFAQGTIENFDAGSDFDAVIGRFVLIHLADAGEALKRLSRSLRRGATITFIELDLTTAAAYPPLPLLQQCISWIMEVYRRTGRPLDMGVGLFGAFRAAALKPQMIGLTRIYTGEDLSGFDFLVESVRSLLPAMEKLGIVSPKDVDIDTLRERLLREPGAKDHCVFYPRIVGAWATVE